MAQEAAVTEASVRLCGGGGDWRGGRTTLLQDLETLVQVILERGDTIFGICIRTFI